MRSQWQTQEHKVYHNMTSHHLPAMPAATASWLGATGKGVHPAAHTLSRAAEVWLQVTLQNQASGATGWLHAVWRTAPHSPQLRWVPHCSLPAPCPCPSVSPPTAAPPTEALGGCGTSTPVPCMPGAMKGCRQGGARSWDLR